MAKVPQAGRSKTRLLPLLGAQAAAELSAEMSADVFSMVKNLGIPWSIAVDGNPEDPWVQQLPAPWEPQGEGDLGERLSRVLRPGDLAIGTDAPTLPGRLLLQARQSRAEVVLGPAFDGGYTLIRLQDPLPMLREIPWSSNITLLTTVQRAQNLGRSLELLEFWYDVDTPADLQFLQVQLQLLGEEVAPATRALLRHWEHCGLLPGPPRAVGNIPG